MRSFAEPFNVTVRPALAVATLGTGGRLIRLAIGVGATITSGVEVPVGMMLPAEITPLITVALFNVVPTIVEFVMVEPVPVMVTLLSEDPLLMIAFVVVLLVTVAAVTFVLVSEESVDVAFKRVLLKSVDVATVLFVTLPLVIVELLVLLPLTLVLLKVVPLAVVLATVELVSDPPVIVEAVVVELKSDVPLRVEFVADEPVKLVKVAAVFERVEVVIVPPEMLEPLVTVDVEMFVLARMLFDTFTPESVARVTVEKSTVLPFRVEDAIVLLVEVELMSVEFEMVEVEM